MPINPVYTNAYTADQVIANILNDTYPQVSQNTITFTGAAGAGQAADVITHFTTTGVVLVKHIFGIVTTTLTQSAGTPNYALGVASAGTLFIGATTATGLTSTNKIWATTTPTAHGIAEAAASKDIIIVDNIVGTVGGTNNINGGVLTIYCIWQPISAGAGLQ